jgi:raffinose/stachyose/melibiose transport system permease protein
MKPKTKRYLMYGLEVFTIILFIVFMIPFFLVLINSMKETSFEVTNYPLVIPPLKNISVLFDNVKEIWTSPNINYRSSFFASTVITVFSLGFITLFSSMAAWVLVRTKTKTSAIIFLLFVSAMVIPFQVVMFPLVTWFAGIGRFVSKELLPLIGINGVKFSLLRSYTGMIFAYIGFGAPLSIFLFHGFIKSIPKELEEAATIDGCNRVQLFSKIILPILKPIYVTVLILNGIWIWNDFLLPLLILGKGNDIQTIPLAVANFVGAFVKEWDLILTAALMAMIPIIILFLFAQKHIIKGMVEGSIK